MYFWTLPLGVVGNSETSSSRSGNFWRASWWRSRKLTISPSVIVCPSRGMTTAQVQARFGAPTERLDPRGGQKRQWPTINRWVYPAFTVYFEKQRVIDVVANQAGADEIGPKPPIR